MSKVEKRKELNTASLNADEMIKSYPIMRLVVMSIILIALTVIAVLSFMYKEYVCAIGIILFVIYVCVLTFGQKSSDYSFEFREGTGLAGFKIFYRGKEVELDYKLDRNGRFMWTDPKKPITCIRYADGSSMNKYITQYRILNYVNVFMQQNGLTADNAW